jgi:hypothetical protein
MQHVATQVAFPGVGRLFTNKAGRIQFDFDPLLREFFELERERVIPEVRPANHAGSVRRSVNTLGMAWRGVHQTHLLFASGRIQAHAWLERHESQRFPPFLGWLGGRAQRLPHLIPAAMRTVIAASHNDTRPEVFQHNARPAGSVP